MKAYDDGQASIYLGDVRDVLRELPEQSAHTCVTSPPYWALRDYGVAGQLGLESTPEEYVANMVDVFREVRRVLRDDGTLWLNIGDSYAANTGRENPVGTGKGGGGKGPTPRPTAWSGVTVTPVDRPAWLKPKDLVGIPWMLAFALRADGWYLRSDIIWAKPNPMPESVTDRPTKAHEYLFLLSKKSTYYYDADAIREPNMGIERPNFDRVEGGLPKDALRAVAGGNRVSRAGNGRKTDKQRGHSRRHAGFNDRWDAMTKEEQAADGRNKRTVWTIATQPYPEAHFATFPEALVEPCILAGSPSGGTVLEPFAGSGTTLAVAKRLGRRAVGIELNEAYIDLARKRCAQMGMILEEPA